MRIFRWVPKVQECLARGNLKVGAEGISGICRKDITRQETGLQRGSRVVERLGTLIPDLLWIPPHFVISTITYRIWASLPHYLNHVRHSDGTLWIGQGFLLTLRMVRQGAGSFMKNGAPASLRLRLIYMCYLKTTSSVMHTQDDLL